MSLEPGETNCEFTYNIYGFMPPFWTESQERGYFLPRKWNFEKNVWLGWHNSKANLEINVTCFSVPSLTGNSYSALA